MLIRGNQTASGINYPQEEKECGAGVKEEDSISENYTEQNRE